MPTRAKAASENSKEKMRRMQTTGRREEEGAGGVAGESDEPEVWIYVTDQVYNVCQPFMWWFTTAG